MELFPNGLLIEKSADTIVQPDLEVDVIGVWCDTFFVDEPKAERQRAAYESELQEQSEKLVVLEAEMLTIDPKQKGSHANRVKAVARRVECLERGLAERTVDISENLQEELAPIPVFSLRDVVQLPSGNPAMVFGIDGPQVILRAKDRAGKVQQLSVQAVALRPYRHRHMATI